MRLRSLVSLASIFTLLCASAFAQTQPKAEAEKDKLTKEQKERIVQMLDESIVAANGLRLPENRATLLAMAGDLYWRFDDKRARELFRSAAADLINFYTETDKEKRDRAGTIVIQFGDPNDVRPMVMPLIAKHDATLALELLVQTRPAKLAEAMFKASQPNNKGTMDLVNLDMDQFRVQQEIALEQQFALLAADEDPDKAIALIKDSLTKGISYSVMPLLQKLFKKDEKKAAELGGEVIKKLVDSDMSKNQTDMITALTFLQNAVNATKATPAPSGSGVSSGATDPPASSGSSPAPAEKQFAFTESQIKELANKVANTLMQPSGSIMTSALLGQAIPTLEKILPDRAVALKQRQAESQRAMPSELKGMQDLQKIFDPNATPEDILSQLSKMPDGPIKSQAYPALESKIGQITDEARAKKLIDQIPDDKERANAQEKYDAAKIARTAATGKLDDARQLISSMTNRRDRIQKLVSLAVQYFKRGKDTDVESAKSIMKEARAMTSDLPADSDEIGDLMEVVRGYTVVEPETAFRMFEPVIDQLNEYVQAASVISKYEKRGQDFRSGELVLSMNAGQRGGGLTFRYIAHIQALGKADLDRMSQLADHFVRPDYRAIVRLFILQGFLADDKKPTATTPQMPMNTVVISN